MRKAFETRGDGLGRPSASLAKQCRRLQSCLKPMCSSAKAKKAHCTGSSLKTSHCRQSNGWKAVIDLLVLVAGGSSTQLLSAWGGNTSENRFGAWGTFGGTSLLIFGRRSWGN